MCALRAGDHGCHGKGLTPSVRIRAAHCHPTCPLQDIEFVIDSVLQASLPDVASIKDVLE